MNTNEYGTVNAKINGEEITLSLTQNAYVENDARYDREGDDDTPPRRAYHARAVDANDNEYIVTWVTLDDSWHYDQDEGMWIADEDEEWACDWDSPVSVKMI